VRNGRELRVAGLRGNAWQSADGGASWSQLAAPVPATIVASATGADGRLLLANQAGLVLRAQGAQLVPVNTRPVPLPSALVFGPGDRLLAVGAAGAIAVGGEKP
jgi:NADPH-dependent 2,4-dienoyl-CoA reductase/sulfur reductase-like enzyme